jgi:hypothetical protein
MPKKKKEKQKKQVNQTKFVTKISLNVENIQSNQARLNLATLLLSLALTAASLRAQTQFFTEITVNPGELTSGQLTRFNKVQQQSTVVESRFVQLADLQLVQQNGWMDLAIPGKCTARVKGKYVETSSSGDYYWSGEVVPNTTPTEDCPCQEGFVFLMENDGEIIGSMSIDGDMYELHDLGGGKSLLAKKDYEGEGITRCGNTNSEGLHPGDETIGDRNGGNCPVRVLALFTANGTAAVPNINNTISLSIFQTNEALKKSGVDESELRLVLQDIQQIPFVEGTSIVNDVNSLINNTDVQNRRNAANADIVIVYTAGAYDGVLGRAGTLTLQNERALCVIQAAEATTEFNISHEAAHLFACRHEEAADPTGVFEHAHEFELKCAPSHLRERNTVMWSVATGNTIPHYSNPNVYYKTGFGWKKTGVVNERDNARQLRTNACTVADFRGDAVIPQLFASIQGPYFGCPCVSKNLSAQVTGGAPGNYLFAWSTSTDGFNWSSVQGTFSTFAVTLPCELGEGIYVRVTVTSVDGQVDEGFAFIESAMTWAGQTQTCPDPIIAPPGGGSVAAALQLLEVEAFPNPIRDKITLDFKSGVEGSVFLKLTDGYGKAFHFEELEGVTDNSRREIDIINIPPGIYFLEFRNINSTSVRKIIKL